MSSELKTYLWCFAVCYLVIIGPVFWEQLEQGATPFQYLLTLGWGGVVSAMVAFFVAGLVAEFVGKPKGTGVESRHNADYIYGNDDRD